MIDRPTAWPDGRPLGGTNGYSPEWHEWARQCEVKYIARQMLRAPQAQRKAVHTQWVKRFPHATPQRIKDVWEQVVEEERATRQATKRNSCAITQRKRNKCATVGGGDAFYISEAMYF